MLPRADGHVVVVGGGHEGVGLAVTNALLHSGAKVVVPVATDEAAERLYLIADPECVPRLRTAVGAPDDPGTLARIAAVARREFGGIDHLVAAWDAPPGDWLNALDAEGAVDALRGHVSAPGLFVLGLLRHLNGNAAAEKRVVLLVAPSRAGARPDALALGRVFGEGLVGLLRGAARPGTSFHALTTAALGGGDDRAAALAGRATAWLLVTGAASAVVDESALDR